MLTLFVCFVSSIMSLVLLKIADVIFFYLMAFLRFILTEECFVKVHIAFMCCFVIVF